MSFKATADKFRSFYHDKFLKFLNNTFEVSYSKASKITGSVLCLLTLLPIIIFINSFTKLPTSTRWIIMAVDLLLPFIIALFTIYTIRFKSEKHKRVFGIVLLFIMPIITMTITECLNNVFIFKMTPLGFLANYVVILIFYFLIFALSGNFRITYLVVNIPVFGFAVAHSYIVEFRGTPFLPQDFSGATTVMGVADSYNFAPNYNILTASLLFILISVIILKLKTPKYSIPTQIVTRAVTGAVSISLLLTFFFTSIFIDMGIQPYFWNQSRGYHDYGFVFNYFANTRYLGNPEPKGYDYNNTKPFIDKYDPPQENPEEPQTPDKEEIKSPNIICIMNESLSDLSVIGDFETNKEYMPFINSLTENTIKGNLYVPVIGGGTSNTEFEFLTGHTMEFLAPGSNAYMLYMKNAVPSMVSTLKAQGYSTRAFHPYYAAGWERTSVYSKFGFDKFYSLESIISPSLINEFKENGNNPDYLQDLIDKHYPGSNMLLRQYISDSYNYELLIDDFENRDKSKPYFMFNVTMQNHGGYVTEAKNFPEDVYLTKNKGKYGKVEEYLSLVRQSDLAFKELISYFKKVKEPTIICMFGDHQPSIEPEFIQELLGTNNLYNLTIEQEQSRRATPFVIWANYDIPEQEIDQISSNYLSSLLLQTAQVKLTRYNKFLLRLFEQLPVINNVGYIDRNNKYYTWDQTTQYSQLLEEYKHVQYNCHFDVEHHPEGVFYLDGYIHEETNLGQEE